MSMNALVTALLDLDHEFGQVGESFLVAGGLGLYIKQRALEEADNAETLILGDLWPPARSTNDVDLMLPTEVVASIDDMRDLRRALDRLGYEPVVPNMQFATQTPRGPVKIDLLTGPVSAANRAKVKTSRPRVRPSGGRGLHAYLTAEALVLTTSPFQTDVNGTRSHSSS